MVNDLYRGKVINHGTEPNELDWVYGNLVVEKSTGRTFIVDLARFDENTKLCDAAIEVDPETVGRYCELEDMCGVEIWEGDIAQYYGDGWDEEDGPGVIKWDEDSARFILENNGLTVDFDNCWPNEMKVIGNHYDNPEMLEE